MDVWLHSGLGFGDSEWGLVALNDCWGHATRLKLLQVLGLASVDLSKHLLDLCFFFNDVMMVLIWVRLLGIKCF